MTSIPVQDIKSTFGAAKYGLTRVRIELDELRAAVTDGSVELDTNDLAEIRVLVDELRKALCGQVSVESVENRLTCFVDGPFVYDDDKAAREALDSVDVRPQDGLALRLAEAQARVDRATTNR
jgi:hypothetical protein